jgi:acyl carrier protein
MDKEQIIKQIKNIASVVFEIEESSINENLTAGSIEAWDSLGHLKFFLSIENHFNVKFSTDEIIHSTSLTEIIDRVKQKLS